MALEAKTLEHIAHLARLDLTESEAASLRREISDLIDYVDLLDDTPLVNPPAKKTMLSRRDDTPHQTNGEPLVSLAADREDQFVRVPRVLPP